MGVVSAGSETFHRLHWWLSLRACVVRVCVCVSVFVRVFVRVCL